jgi:hypothetical protein
MIEYILVVMLLGSSPAVSFQEFKSKETCEAAKNVLATQTYLKPSSVVCMKK